MAFKTSNIFIIKLFNKYKFHFLLASLIYSACTSRKDDSTIETHIETTTTNKVLEHEDTSFAKSAQEEALKSDEYYDTLNFSITYEPPFYKQSLTIDSKASHENWSSKANYSKHKSSFAKYLYLIDGSDSPSTSHRITSCLFCEKNQYLYIKNPNYTTPNIIHFPISSGKNLKALTGYVCFDTKHFQGASIPFEGFVEGGIKEIYLDGKKVNFTNNSELFFRQKLDIYIGYNKIPLKIIDTTNKETNTWVIIETEKADNSAIIENHININN